MSLQRYTNAALARYNYERSLPGALQRPIKIGAYLMILWAIRSTIATAIYVGVIAIIAHALYVEYHRHNFDWLWK
jgi:hypothetical protein